VTADSIMTWATILRVRQPSAFSVPISRPRRATVVMVSRLATAHAMPGASQSSSR
jgi:hypothetical protein